MSEEKKPEERRSWESQAVDNDRRADAPPLKFGDKPWCESCEERESTITEALDQRDRALDRASVATSTAICSFRVGRRTGFMLAITCALGIYCVYAGMSAILSALRQLRGPAAP